MKCPDASMHPVLGFDVEAAIKKCEVALEQARTLRGGQIICQGVSLTNCSCKVIGHLWGQGFCFNSSNLVTKHFSIFPPQSTWGSRFELKRFRGAASRKSRKSPNQSSPKRRKKYKKSFFSKVLPDRVQPLHDGGWFVPCKPGS